MIKMTTKRKRLPLSRHKSTSSRMTRMCNPFASDKMDGSQGMGGTLPKDETNQGEQQQQNNNETSSSSMVLPSGTVDQFSNTERDLLQRLLDPTSVQEVGSGTTSSSNGQPTPQGMEGLFSNPFHPSQITSGNLGAEQNFNDCMSNNDRLTSYHNHSTNAYHQSNQGTMAHMQPNQSMTAFDGMNDTSLHFNQNMMNAYQQGHGINNTHQQGQQDMSGMNAYQPSQGMSLHNNYQGMNHTSAASSMMMPQRQHQYSHNELNMALARLGYGNPSMSSSSPHTELSTPTTKDDSNGNSSRASATHLAQANMLFANTNTNTHDPSSSTRPYQGNSNFGPPSSMMGQHNNNMFQCTNSSSANTTSTEADWFSSQHHQRSTSLHNFGGPISNFDGNPLSHQHAGSAAPSSASLKPPSYASSSSRSSLPSSQPASASSSRPASSTASPQFSSLNSNQAYPTRLVVPSDSTFLDPIHIFLRSTCLELFLTTKEHMTCPGRGARASKVGQVGMRCSYCRDLPQQELTRQAICYPSKRDTIFESVRNYQRVHLENCPRIPQEVKDKYKRLLDRDFEGKKSQRFLKAYYTEAASELGLVDAPKGLIFGRPPNTSGVPMERLQAVITASNSPSSMSHFWKQYNASTKENKLELRKFDNLASEETREVLRNARREESPFVLPQDFPTVSDVEFLLFKQVVPCRPSSNALKRRGVDPDTEEFKGLAGLCCRHCARTHEGESHHNGMYFPMNLQALTDSSFSQSLLNHVMGCRNVPQETKGAFQELKHLASEHCVITKRGSKKKFLEKIWGRMQNYYA